MDAELPPFVQEIAEMIGETNALRIVYRYGGLRLRFGPIRDELEDIIGAEATLAMLQRFHRVDVTIPRCSGRLRNIRNAALHERFETLSKTMSARRAVNELVVEFTLTERWVWRLLKR